MLISIGKYLSTRQNGTKAGPQDPRQDLSEAHLQAADMLLEALEFHSVTGDDGDYDEFKERLTSLRRQLSLCGSPFEILEVASEAREALDSYVQKTAEFFRCRNAELNGVVAMLTEAVAAVSDGSRQTLRRLQAIEKRIEHASMADDIRVLKASLGDCLNLVRAETRRQREDSGNLVARLEQHKQKVSSKASAKCAAQPESRSPVNLLVQEVVDDDMEAGAPMARYAVVFVLDRAEAMRTRFGDPIKHRVLAAVCKQLKERLAPGDRLLRWKGAAFVAFLERDLLPDEIRSELRRIADISPEYCIDAGDRSIRLSLSISWSMYALADYQSLDPLFQEIDAFIAQHT